MWVPFTAPEHHESYSSDWIRARVRLKAETFGMLRIINNMFSNVYRTAQHRWNLHYVGCVRVTAEILELGCKSDCQKKCSAKPEKDCALCYFAQGNAVRCVEAHRNRQTFESHARIRACFPYMFEQLGLLKNVIVLQGRDQSSGNIHEDFKKKS